MFIQTNGANIQTISNSKTHSEYIIEKYMLLAAGVQRNHISTLSPVAVADLGLTEGWGWATGGQWSTVPGKS